MGQATLLRNHLTNGLSVPTVRLGYVPESSFVTYARVRYVEQ